MVVVVLVLQYHCCLTPHTTHTHTTHTIQRRPRTPTTQLQETIATLVLQHTAFNTPYTHTHTHTAAMYVLLLLLLVPAEKAFHVCAQDRNLPAMVAAREGILHVACPVGGVGKRDETQVCVGGGSERGRIGRCRDRRVTGRRKRRQEGGMGSRTRIGNLVNAMVLSMVTSPMCVVAVIESTAIESIQSLFGDL
jgi:hypothetical protein